MTMASRRRPHQWLDSRAFPRRGDPLVTLYQQEPDGTFKDITKEAGLTHRGWGMGVAVADYDNDASSTYL